MNRLLAKNILSLAFLQGSNYLIPLITLPYLVRILGPDHYGRIGFATSFVQYFALITDFGFNLSATQSVAANQNSKSEVSRIFWTVTLAKSVLCICGAFVLLGLTFIVPKLEHDRQLLLIAYLNVVGTLVFPVWLFQGLERMGLITACSFFARLTLVAPIFLFIHAPSDFARVVLIQASGGILAGVASLAYGYRSGIVSWQRPSISGVRTALLESWPLFLSTGAISLYTNTTVVVLGFIAGDSAVGQFVAADKIRAAVQGLISPISQSVYPRVCALMAEAPARAFDFIRRLLVLQGSGTFVVSLALFLSSALVTSILLGPKFHDSIATLRILAFLPFVIGMSNVFGIQTMLPLGMKTTFRNLLIGSGLINLVLLLPLAYFYAANGAAASVLITECIVTAAMAVVLRRRQVPIFFANEPADAPV